MNKNIVITGYGALASNGNDTDSLWEAMLNGKDGYSDSYKNLDDDFPFKLVGLVNDFDPTKYLSTDEVNNLDKSAQFSVAAAAMALEKSKLDLNSIDKHRVGVIVGSTCGTNLAVENNDFVNRWFTNKDSVLESNYTQYNHASIPNAISQKYGFKGVSYLTGTACASGNHSIGEAFDLLHLGKADTIVCGGAEALNLLPLLGFNSTRALDSTKCAPFDKNRDGIVLGEGAGMIILETEEHAQNRGAEIFAYLKGWSANCDAGNITAPIKDGSKCSQLIDDCLKNSGVNHQDIDYISLHGTGTPANDETEKNAIHRSFGENWQKPYVSSIKSIIGHTFGAAGSIEAVVSVMALEHQKLPPHINITELEDDYRLNFVTELNKQVNVNTILSLSFGFGGCNIATIFSKNK